MKWALLGSTALITVAANGAAMAADLGQRAPAMPVKAPVAVAPPFNWTGFYVGPVVGYSWRDPSINFTGNAAAQATFLSTGVVPNSIPVDPKGFLGGLQTGFNFQAGMAVFGFETDFSYANIHDGGTAGPGLDYVFLCGKFCTAKFTSSADQKLDRFGTVRARFGLTPVEQLLLFVTGGFAYGHANLNASVLNVTATQFFPTIPLPPCTQLCAAGSTSQWLTGWTAGFGAEYAFTRFWSV